MSKHRLGQLLIILIAFALRLTMLGEQSLWYDEGVTWLLSQMQLPDLINWTAADIQPPLYYLIIWSSEITFGGAEWALRFPSAVFNTLTVPLIFVLAHRLLKLSKMNAATRYPAALLATAIFALSPLMIYYSQEARMYTLLVLEASLASYLLLKILHPALSITSNTTLAFSHHPKGTLLPPLARTSGLIYALTAAAALYTHYFAAFLIAAHALYTLIVLWQYRWPKRLILQALLMFGLTILFFGPWLPALLARWGDDPSYWPGALKLDEALRKVFISFSAGETVFEQAGTWFTGGYLAILIISGLLILITRLANNRDIVPSSSFTLHNSLVFLMLWLCLPIVLILALSYQSPKFNPRYTMLAYPAFILLLTIVLSRLGTLSLSKTKETRQTPSPAAHASRLIFTLALLFILATSLFSLFNWFTDPRFSKDDFKALAQFVRERMAADETVLLSSGHIFPVWAYYFGWDNWTPLPWMQRLDVNRVTDLSIAGDIATAIEGKAGVWLVTWQDEVIDPNGVVFFWLDRIGRRPVDAGDFWGVGLEHWRLNGDSSELLHQDPIARPAIYKPAIVSEEALSTDSSLSEPITLTPSATLNTEDAPSTNAGDTTVTGTYNFAEKVELLGLTQVSDNDIALFWQAHQPLPDDLLLTLDLTDENGFDWDRETVKGRPGGYFYPPSRWPVGNVVMTRHQLPWQIGTPPGLYVLEIGLGQAGQPDSALSARDAPGFSGWDVVDYQGRPQRRTALIDFINLSRLVEPDNAPLPIAPKPLVDLLPIVAVRRSILPKERAEPGDRILLALLWQAGEYNLDNVSVAFDIVDAENQTFRVGSSLTPSRRYNLPRWEPGELVLGQYWLDIPPDAAPGPATLNLHVVNVSGYAYDEVFPMDHVEILPTERNFSAPESFDISLEANFSDQALLLGVDCQPSACRQTEAGESVTLTLYWQAKASLDRNYTVFTHLLGKDEIVLANADHMPAKPTRGWVSGEIIADPVTLTLPADLRPGEYRIEVGLYDAADPMYTRLPLVSGETRVMIPQALQVKDR